MKNKSIITVMIISFIVFLSMTFWLTSDNGFMYDANIIDWTERVSTDGLIAFMEALSVIGSSEVILLLTAVIAGIFLLKRNWFFLLCFLTVSVGGVVLTFGLEMLVRSARPGGELTHIGLLNFSVDLPSYSHPRPPMMRASILFTFLVYPRYRLIFKT